MSAVSVVWEFQQGRDGFVPIAVFTKRVDADAFQQDQPNRVFVVDSTMAKALDDLVITRLHGLGLKLAIIEETT